MKRSVVSNHVKCNKHKLGKERLLRKEARERDRASACEECQHPRGETLPEEERVYRAKVGIEQKLYGPSCEPLLH